MPKILNVCGQRCLSRVEYIKAFSDYINLNWEPVVMPNDFKINRPEKHNNEKPSFKRTNIIHVG